MLMLDSDEFSCAACTRDHGFHGNTTVSFQLVQQIHNLFSSSSSDVAIQGVVSHPLLLLFKCGLSQGRASVEATSIGLRLKGDKFYNYGVVKNWGCVNHLSDRLPTCGLRWRGMVGECGGVEEGGCVLVGGGEGWCLSSNNCLMRICSSCSLTCGTQQVRAHLTYGLLVL